MPKLINGVPQRDNFQSTNEQRWFSIIAHAIDQVEYANINVTLVVKKGKVVNVKTNTENNFNVGGI